MLKCGDTESDSVDALSCLPPDANREIGDIGRCRQLLGDEAIGLSDEEVDLIRQHADAMAHVIVAMFIENDAK